ERAVRRLEHAILLAPVAGLGGGAIGHGVSQSQPGHGAAVTGAGAAATAKAAAVWSLATKIGVAAVLLGAGAAVGAGVNSHYESHHDIASAATQTTTAAIEPVASVVVASTATVPAPIDSSPPADKPPTVMASHDTSSAVSGAKNGESTSLGDEQQLIDMARAAVARGAYQAAENSLDEHQRRFPNGTLSEEREFLAVQALAGAGDMSKCRERATRFEKRYPNSIFLPAVEKTSGIQSE
ncbi:MAG: outer membrane protein assembly factor BamD, partial [Polyangiaceae bacterium]